MNPQAQSPDYLAQLGAARPQRATIEADKAKPRFSLKDGLSRENLNGQTRVHQANFGSPDRVVCRHLAAEYVLEPGKKADLLKKFASKEGITKHFKALGGELDQRFDSLLNRAREDQRHVVSPGHLSDLLVSMASEMDRSTQLPQSSNLLILTPTHVTAAQLQLKERKADEAEPGARYFAFSKYDPNQTGNHLRLEFSNPQDLAVVKNRDVRAVICLDRPSQLNLDDLAPDAGAQHLTWGLRLDMPEVMSAMVAKARDMEPAKLRACLSATLPSGIPAFHWAMHGSSTPTLRAHLQLIEVAARRLNLDADSVTELIESKHAGHTALHRAATENRAVSLKALGDSLPRLALPSANLKRLLKAPDESSGQPALHRAAQLGHTAVIYAFAHVLSQLGDTLSAEDKLALFDAPGPAGDNAAKVALVHGHKQAAQAHAELRDQWLKKP